VIAGYDAADPTTVPVAVPDYRAALAAGARGLRIGVPRSGLFAPVASDVLAAVDAALRVLAGLGAEAREVEVPALPTTAMFDLIVTEAKHIHAATLASRAGDLGRDLQLYLSEPPGDALRVVAALGEVRDYAAALRAVIEEVDLLALPTCPIGAPPIGADLVEVGGVEMQTFFAMSLRTAPFNAAGLPALSVPCGFTSDGLPIGLQLVGRPFDEPTVLRAGHAYEQATDWTARRPPL
jgi:aspartyl-tRNA(Asn)/glutamyl-tRNA(Gln) amidotransferase subunit A